MQPDEQISIDLYNPSDVQREAHACTAHEILYGGTAGCGKTVFLEWDPIVTQVFGEHERFIEYLRKGVPWKSKGWSIHFRREFPMLKQTMEFVGDFIRKVDPGVHWDAEGKIYTFTCGFRYQFSHLQREEDYRIYDSSAYTGVYFDELIQFTKKQFDFLTSRVRTSDPVLRKRLRICSATNPDAPIEGLWVKERYVDPAPEGRKLLFEEVVMSDGTKEENTMLFIPATLSDNPDAGFRVDYERRLRKLPHHVMLARLMGYWNVVDNAFFAYEWKPEHHVVDPFELPAGWTKFRAMDWGYKEACVVLWFAVNKEGDLIVYREVTFNHKVPESKRKDAQLVAIAIREIEIANGEWDKARDCSMLSGPADTQIWTKVGTIGPSIAETMSAYGVWWEKCTKDESASTAEVVRRLRDIPKARSARPGVTVFRTCQHLVRTFPTIKTDPDNPEAPLTKGQHWYDTFKYGCMHRAAKPMREDAPPPDPHTFDEDDELDKFRQRRSSMQGYRL
jgi:hypothetical protein